MRPFSFLPKVLRVLLLANAAVFVVAFVLGGIMGLQLNIPGVGPGNVRDYITYFGAYFPTEPLEVWRYVTYMFVHVDFWHFLFNMLMLWMFGAEVVDMMGAKAFTGMYIFCGIFAAVFSLIMCVLGLTNNPIIGASGALMGLFVAYYKFFPNRMILMFMFFPMRIKYAMWFMVGIDVFMAPSGDGVAHLAHLGGVVGGFLFMHFYENGFGGIADKVERAARKAREPKFKVNEGGRKSDEPIEGEVFYIDENKRMDEILKKVNESGINSLTDAERKFLLDASEKLRRRR